MEYYICFSPSNQIVCLPQNGCIKFDYGTDFNQWQNKFLFALNLNISFQVILVHFFQYRYYCLRILLEDNENE